MQATDANSSPIGMRVDRRPISRLFFPRAAPLDLRTQAIYQQMLEHLQRDMLVLLVALGCVSALFTGASLAHSIWVLHALPPAMFAVQVARVGLIVGLVVFFLRRDQITLAWYGWLIVSVGTLLIDIWLSRELGLLGVALFCLAGFALTRSLRATALAVAGIVAAVLLEVAFAFPAYPDNLVPAILIFCTLVFGCACIGVVIRRFVRRFAQASVESEQAAARTSRLEQQMIDLRRQVHTIASLEHDLRQPLRVIQGYHTLLRSMLPQTEPLLSPAAAAVQRANRLVNNLLDLARADARQQHNFRQPADLNQLFARVRQATPGLAQYYTDPPVAVHFSIQLLPHAAVDAEQLERALLNLLDNALAVSPPGGAIEVCAWSADDHLSIEVQDMGPGIPDSVIHALSIDTPPERAGGTRSGLGLPQVSRVAQAHGGALTFTVHEQGTTVHLTLALAETL